MLSTQIIVKHNLTKEQRKLLVGWAAEGLELWEINERAAKCDPPFEIKWHNLKWVRQRAKKTYGSLKEEFEREAIIEGLSRRAVRLRQKMDRHALLKQVISERGEEMKGEIAGAGTGLLVRDYKGKNADTAIYKLDAALLKEMRDLEREIAIELGQWTEKRELTGAGGEPLLDPLVAALEKAYGNGEQQPTATN